VTDTHVLLRETKRRPSGLRVERSIPTNATSRAAAEELRTMPPGKSNTLLGVCKHLVQDWMVVLERRTGIRCHAHKFRATFASTMLERGVDVRTVMELMGHTNLATTLKYLSVSDARLMAAVQVL
jgi:integrase